MNINPFGEIDLNNLEECYGGEINVDGNPIEIGINFDSKKTYSGILKKVSGFLENIESHIKKAFDSLSRDYDLDVTSATVKYYLEHNQNELSEDVISKIFGTTDISKEIYFKNIRVLRVDLFPEDEQSYAIIDFKLPDEYTDFILAVTFDGNGDVSYISMDS